MHTPGKLLTAEQAKAEMEQRAISKPEATAEWDNFAAARKNYFSANSEMINATADFYRSCYRINNLQVYKAFNFKTAEEMIAKKFSDEDTKTAFREGKQVYAGFLRMAMELPEFKKQGDGVEKFVDKKVDRLFKILDNNSEYVKEAGRVNLFGKNETQANENIDKVKKIKDASKNKKEFKAKLREEFEPCNPKRVDGSEKRKDRASGASVSLNMKCNSPDMKSVVKMFETANDRIGGRKPFKEMNSSALGSLIYLISIDYNSGDVVPIGKTAPTAAERREFGRGALRKAFKFLQDADLDEGQLDLLMERVAPVLQAFADIC